MDQITPSSFWFTNRCFLITTYLLLILYSLPLVANAQSTPITLGPSPPKAQFPPSMHVNRPFYFPLQAKSFICPPDASFVISGLPPWMQFNLGGSTISANWTRTPLQAEFRAAKVPPFPEFKKAQVIIVFMTITVTDVRNRLNSIATDLELPLVQYPPPTVTNPLINQLRTRIDSLKNSVEPPQESISPAATILDSTNDSILYLPSGAPTLDLDLESNTFDTPTSFNNMSIPPTTYAMYDSETFKLPAWITFTPSNGAQPSKLSFKPPLLDQASEQSNSMGYFMVKLAASNIPGWSNSGTPDTLRIKRGNLPPVMNGNTPQDGLTLNTQSNTESIRLDLNSYFMDPNQDPLTYTLEPAPGQVSLNTLSVSSNGTFQGIAQRSVIMRVRAKDIVNTESADWLTLKLVVGGSQPLTTSSACTSQLESGASCYSFHAPSTSQFEQIVPVNDLFATASLSTISLAPNSPSWLQFDEDKKSIFGTVPQEVQDPVMIYIRATDAASSIAEARIELRQPSRTEVPQNSISSSPEPSYTVSIVTISVICVFLASFLLLIYYRKSRASQDPNEPTLSNLLRYNKDNGFGGFNQSGKLMSVNGSYMTDYTQPHSRYESSLMSFNSISRPSSMGYAPQKLQMYNNHPQMGVVVSNVKSDNSSDIGMSEYCTSESNSTHRLSRRHPGNDSGFDYAYKPEPAYKSQLSPPKQGLTTLPNDSGWVNSSSISNFRSNMSPIHAPPSTVTVNMFHQGHVPEEPLKAIPIAHYHTNHQVYSSVSMFHDSELTIGQNDSIYFVEENSQHNGHPESLSKQHIPIDPHSPTSFNNKVNPEPVSVNQLPTILRRPSVRGELLRKCLARVEHDRMASRTQLSGIDENLPLSNMRIAPAATRVDTLVESQAPPFQQQTNPNVPSTHSTPTIGMTPSSTHTSALSTTESSSSVDDEIGEMISIVKSSYTPHLQQDSARTSIMSTLSRYGNTNRSAYTPNTLNSLDEEHTSPVASYPSRSGPHKSLKSAESIAQCLSDLLSQYADNSEGRISSLTSTESGQIYKETIAIVNEYETYIPNQPKSLQPPPPLPPLPPSVLLSTAPNMPGVLNDVLQPIYLHQQENHVKQRNLVAPLPSPTSLHCMPTLCDAAIVRNLVAYVGIPFQYILTLPPPPPGMGNKRGSRVGYTNMMMRMNMLTRIECLSTGNNNPSRSLNNSQVSLGHSESPLHRLTQVVTGSNLVHGSLPTNPSRVGMLSVIQDVSVDESLGPGLFGVPGSEMIHASNVHEYPSELSAKQVARMTYPNPYATISGSGSNRSSDDSYMSGSWDTQFQKGPVPNPKSGKNNVSVPKKQAGQLTNDSGIKLGMLYPIAAATELNLAPIWISASLDTGKRTGILRGTPFYADVGEWAVEVIIRLDDHRPASNQNPLSVFPSHSGPLAKEIVVWKAVVRVMAR